MEIFKRLRIPIAIISIAGLIIGFLVNPTRKPHTAEIFGWATWTWEPFLYLEHFLGEFFLGNLFFAVMLSALILGLLIPILICIIFKRKLQFKFKIIEFSKYFSIIIAFVFPIGYELIWQKGTNIDQFIFDVGGFILYLFYINKAFPTRSFKEIIKSFGK